MHAEEELQRSQPEKSPVTRIPRHRSRRDPVEWIVHSDKFQLEPLVTKFSGAFFPWYWKEVPDLRPFKETEMPLLHKQLQANGDFFAVV